MQRQFQLLQADYITDLCLVSGSVAVQKTQNNLLDCV